MDAKRKVIELFHSILLINTQSRIPTASSLSLVPWLLLVTTSANVTATAATATAAPIWVPYYMHFSTINLIKRFLSVVLGQVLAVLLLLPVLTRATV